MRAFIGIDLPEAVRESLGALQRELAESHADVKWVEPANLHITLKFLGEISEEQRREVEALLKRLAAQTPRFLVSLEGVGAFPSIRAPRVVWVGISQGSNAVTGLAESIERESAALGFQREEREFAPHLTLGRVRSGRQRRELTQRLETLTWTPLPAWSASTVTLYQSVLSAAGPRYSVLAEVPLRKPEVGS